MPQLWCGDKAVKLVPRRKLCNEPVIFTLSKPRISLQHRTPCWVFMLDEQTMFTFILLATRKKHLRRIMMWQSGRHSFPLLFQHPLGSVLVLWLWLSNWWFVRSVKTFLFHCHCELKFLQHCAYVLLSFWQSAHPKYHCPNNSLRLHQKYLSAGHFLTVNSDKKSCRSSSRTMKSIIFYAKLRSHHQSIFSPWNATVRWYWICLSEGNPQGLQGLHRKSIYLSISRVIFNFLDWINNYSHLTKILA